jgi:hypothetical protein
MRQTASSCPRNIGSGLHSATTVGRASNVEASPLIDHIDTVVSFHEAPTLENTPRGVDADIWRKGQIQSMRYNVLNVLLQQSSQGSKLYEQKPLSQNSIRLALKEALERSDPDRPELGRIHSDLPILPHSRSRAVGDEGTSNLFYYLFEDYTAAGPLKAAGKILEEIVSPPFYNNLHT